ncbi:feoA domain protein [Clostridioides difficile P13]|nr:feoA domain protein [Clostridioides difficile P13]
MLALGLTRGAVIDVVRKGPKNNLTVYKIRGSKIALRQEESSLILVSDI